MAAREDELAIDRVANSYKTDPRKAAQIFLDMSARETADSKAFFEFFHNNLFMKDPRFSDFSMLSIFEHFTAKQIQDAGSRMSELFGNYWKFIQVHTREPWRVLEVDKNADPALVKEKVERARVKLGREAFAVMHDAAEIMTKPGSIGLVSLYQSKVRSEATPPREGIGAVIPVLSRLKELANSKHRDASAVRVSYFMKSHLISDILDGILSKKLSDEAAQEALLGIRKDKPQLFEWLKVQLRKDCELLKTVKTDAPETAERPRATPPDQTKLHEMTGGVALCVLTSLKTVAVSEHPKAVAWQTEHARNSSRIARMIRGFRENTLTDESAMETLSGLNRDNPGFFRTFSEAIQLQAKEINSLPSIAPDTTPGTPSGFLVKYNALYKALQEDVSNNRHKHFQSTRNPQVNDILGKLERKAPAEEVLAALKQLHEENPRVYAALREDHTIFAKSTAPVSAGETAFFRAPKPLQTPTRRSEPSETPSPGK